MEQIKVEIGNYRPVEKGALKGFFSLIIHPTGQKINDCRYFEQGDNRWFNLPQKEVKFTDGRKVEYYPIISFMNKSYESALKIAVVDAIRNHKDKPHAQNQATEQSKQANPFQSDAPTLW